jgi:excisionase family DNA binding protein
MSNTIEVRFLTVEELAERYRCSKQHIGRQLAAGKLPRPIRVGALVRWRLEAIEAWENEQSQKS